ncbi:hypothetical protein PARPLA_02635 [Rhodobacteraceae bacterium THAF1]|uniref:DUF3572 domain-containing protein n=1 Tax=Palleronia sp. THAF1 TaxID=2587842 RepID=UPI000F3F664A|nr:DUF3572 domain-containing protein [Palleronia sp. THAF1]QFU08113.1 hypothetical protein FIU81_05450 [Palleronia sp. THAF1]VDC27980.1 hypothetical protein PARPLA_02635 [Rhodobacteraceae bacterium THAF1]
MKQETAEGVAQEVLIWLAQDEDLLPVFLGATGADASDLRNAAQDSVFLGSVLDFLLMDDAWITRFCTTSNYAYDIPQRARQALPGGEEVHWT